MTAVGFAYLILVLTGAVYLFRLVRFRIGLSRLKTGEETGRPSVAVVLAARNEEAEIGACLEGILAQDYPPELLSVVVVDDGSSDDTPNIVSRLAAEHNNLKLIRVEEPPPGIAPKKYAVSRGVEAVDSEIIAITDADCRVGPGWIKGLVSHFRPEVGIVLGFTTYRRDPAVGRILYGVQTLEFLSHVFCAAGAIGDGRAFNSNANNLAYRRVVYREVGGLESGGRYISGDDDLFLQSVVRRTRWRADFAIEPATHVQTRSTKSWSGIIRQRMRWASKWSGYNPDVVLFLTATFIFFLGLFLLVPLSLPDPIGRPLPLVLFGLKAVGDYLVISAGAGLFQVKGILRFFPLVELIHIPLILSAAAGGQFASHQWRGRRLKRRV